MIDLRFRVLGARPERHTATPQLSLDVEVENHGAGQVHSGTLCCQVRIDPTRRAYGPDERERLFELFGAPEQWERSLRSLLWTHTQATLPAVDQRAVLALPLPCTYDFNLSAVKYLDGVEGGEVTLRLLFSGTVFYSAEPDGPLQVWPVPWSQEDEYRLPIGVWRELMQDHYAGSAFLGLRKDVFDRLRRFKAEHALTTWEQALEHLLDQAATRSEQVQA